MSTISPNMGLVIPAVGQDYGPQWAQNINASLSILDGHSHVSGSGVPITPSAISMTSDLSFNSQNATVLRSTRYVSQGSALSASTDVGCVYVVNGNLYFNYNSSTPVQITTGASVNGSAGTITGLPSGTAGATFSAGSGTFVFTQATSTAANMDVGSLIIRYPGSYPVPSGNYVALQAPSSLATGLAFTLPNALPGSNNSFVTCSTSGVFGYTTLTSLVDNATIQATGNQLSVIMANLVDNATTQLSGNQIIVKTVQQSNIYKKQITSTPTAAGNVGYTGASGSTNSNSQVPFTVSFSITTTGRPVMWMLVCPGASVVPTTYLVGGTGYGVVNLYVDGSNTYNWQVASSSTTRLAPSNAYQVLLNLAAGTHTFQLFGQTSTTSTTLWINADMAVYEL